MQFSPADKAAILSAVGEDIPVKFSGTLVTTLKGYTQHEEIIDSPNSAEIGSKVLTLKLDADAYDALDKTKKYTFAVGGTDYIARGPATQDGGGFKKLQLTKA
jgi:hypothetical protein